jgi:hypothetical protein
MGRWKGVSAGVAIAPHLACGERGFLAGYRRTPGFPRRYGFGSRFPAVKRQLLTILLFLLLGAVVNIAVAWGCAAFITPYCRSFVHAHCIEESESNVEWTVFKISRLGSILIESYRFPDSDTQSRTNNVVPHPRTLVPYWCDLYPLPDGRGYEFRVVEARGFPVLSMWSESYGEYELTSGELTTRPAQGGAELQDSPWFWDDVSRIPRVIPLRPIWPGFAINTVFYAAVIWLPIRGPFMLRRHLRRKRGRCLKCGYDLRGNLVGGCPECRWNREEAKA